MTKVQRISMEKQPIDNIIYIYIHYSNPGSHPKRLHELFFEIFSIYNQPSTLTPWRCFQPCPLTPKYRVHARFPLFIISFYLVSFLNTHSLRDVMWCDDNLSQQFTQQSYTHWTTNRMWIFYVLLNRWKSVCLFLCKIRFLSIWAVLYELFLPTHYQKSTWRV